MQQQSEYSSEIQSLEAFVELFKRNPHLELEGRLGRFDERARSFTSGVSEAYFKQLLEMFQGSNCWSRRIDDQMSVDSFYSGNIRHSTNGKIDGNTTMMKTVVATLTLVCVDRRYDIRFRLSEEKPLMNMPTNENYHTARCKIRNSFIMSPEEVQYDMTAVQSGSSKEMACANKDSLTYEVEVELLRLKDASSVPDRLFARVVQLLGIYNGQGEQVHLRFNVVENTLTKSVFERFDVSKKGGATLATTAALQSSMTTTTNVTSSKVVAS